MLITSLSHALSWTGPAPAVRQRYSPTTFYGEHLRYSFFLSSPNVRLSLLLPCSSASQLRTWPMRATAFVCQFLLPFLSPGTWSSSSRKGAKPGRSGDAGLAVMVGKESGLDSNSVAPSGRLGRNCGPVCPQALHPLSSASVRGALVMRRRPKRSDQGKSAE